MARRYGPIGQAAQREAVKHLNGEDSPTGGAQNWAQFQANRFVASTNLLKGLAPRPGLEPGTLRLTADFYSPLTPTITHKLLKNLTG